MTSISDELLPCPFCGNTNPFLEGPARARHVTCNNDLCQASIMPEATDAAAIAAWNRRTVPSHELVREWRPIATAPKDRTPVVIAVPDKDCTGFIVGEAYFDPENNEGGDWWWAGTGWGDYHAGPISEINHHLPTHWQPLPARPPSPPNKEDEDA